MTPRVVSFLFLLIFIFLRVRKNSRKYTPRFCTIIILDPRKWI